MAVLGLGKIPEFLLELSLGIYLTAKGIQAVSGSRGGCEPRPADVLIAGRTQPGPVWRVAILVHGSIVLGESDRPNGSAEL